MVFIVKNSSKWAKVFDLNSFGTIFFSNLNVVIKKIRYTCLSNNYYFVLIIRESNTINICYDNDNCFPYIRNILSPIILLPLSY